MWASRKSWKYYISVENNKNHENLIITHDNHENYDTPIISRENNKNIDNHENH